MTVGIAKRKFELFRGELMPIQRCTIKEAEVFNALPGLGLGGYEALRYPTYLGHQEQVGFFDTFRLTLREQVHQTRDLMVYVFPFADPVWKKAIDAVFAFEQKAWAAWWRWSAKYAAELVFRTQAPLTVHPIPPLVQPPEKVIRPFTLVGHGGLELNGFLRPMIEWPALDFQSLTTERAQGMFQGDFGFKKTLEHVMSAAKAANAIRGQRGQVPGDDFGFDAKGFAELCNSNPEGRNSGRSGRKLLSNGHHIVPTQWRLFHANFHKYELGKSF
jgi:hypothetical protein